MVKKKSPNEDKLREEYGMTRLYQYSEDYIRKEERYDLEEEYINY